MAKKYLLGLLAIIMATQIASAPSLKEEDYQTEKAPISKYIPSKDEERLNEIERKYEDAVNYRTDNFNDDSLEILTARLMMGEDEDNPDICKIADAWTVLNRLNKRTWYGETFKEVALKQNQYSCFNNGSDSSIFLKNPLKHNSADFMKDLKLAKDFWKGLYSDPTHGATHYYNPNRVRKPNWDNHMIFCGRIGQHLYYKERN